MRIIVDYSSYSYLSMKLMLIKIVGTFFNFLSRPTSEKYKLINAPDQMKVTKCCLLIEATVMVYTLFYKEPTSRSSSRKSLCLDPFLSNSSTKSSLIVP